MKSKHFFILSLSLPFIVPLLIYIFSQTSVVFAIFAAPLIFGGVQYLLFIPFFIYLISKIDNYQSLMRLIAFAPLIYTPFQIFGLIIYIFLSSFPPDLTEIASTFFFALFDILYGGFYVILAASIYYLLNLKGYINKDEI